MYTVSATVAFFVILIGAVCAQQSCTNKDVCSLFCSKVQPKCSFNCGDAKSCTQGCVQRVCNDMVCQVKEKCKQLCVNCATKMSCLSPNCEQTCSGDSCNMECSSRVKKCSQICDINSTCTVNCNPETTDCKLTCREGANCTGSFLKKPTPKPQLARSCDEITGNCSKTCTGECKGTILTCDSTFFRECHLSCEKGCTMKCDSKIEKCFQTCIGDTPCISECDAANCYKSGSFNNTSSPSTTPKPPPKLTTKPEPKTQVTGSCDEKTGNCSKTCAGECKGTILTCDSTHFQECHLSCEKGCTMKCDSKIENCLQTCIGDIPCISICDAANCRKSGKFQVTVFSTTGSSSTFSFQTGNAMLLLISNSLMIIH